MKNINPLILVNGALVLFMIANGIIKQDLFTNPFRGAMIFLFGCGIALHLSNDKPEINHKP